MDYKVLEENNNNEIKVVTSYFLKSGNALDLNFDRLSSSSNAFKIGNVLFYFCLY